LELITADASGLLLGSLDQLQHRGDSALVARVNVQQDTLQGHVLVGSGISIFGTSGGGQSQELSQDQQTVVLNLLNIGRSFLGGGYEGIGLFLLQSLRQVLLHLGLVRCALRSVLGFYLLVLGELLLHLSELRLELGFLEDLGLLIGIDDFSSDKFLKGLVLVLLDQYMGLGDVRLVDED